MLLDKISSKFQLRLKDRTNAGNILGETLKDIIKSEEERRSITIVLGKIIQFPFKLIRLYITP